MILATALLLVVINMVASLGVDITYGYLNPKVRQREPVEGRPEGRSVRTWSRFRRDPLAMTALVLLVIIALSGIFYELSPRTTRDELGKVLPFEGRPGTTWPAPTTSVATCSAGCSRPPA